jgi:hypothetical protein
MSQSRKHRGYKTERLVAEYFANNGWQYALATGAGRSGSDVTGVPYFDIEVKARASFQPKAWIDQVGKRTTGKGEIPVVVSRLNGQGSDVGSYLAFLRLSDLVDLMRKAGYDDFAHKLSDADIKRCLDCGVYALGERCKFCREEQ